MFISVFIIIIINNNFYNDIKSMFFQCLETKINQAFSRMLLPRKKKNLFTFYII